MYVSIGCVYLILEYWSILFPTMSSLSNRLRIFPDSDFGICGINVTPPFNSLYSATLPGIMTIYTIKIN